jgi:hypothetical protein
VISNFSSSAIMISTCSAAAAVARQNLTATAASATRVLAMYWAVINITVAGLQPNQPLHGYNSSAGVHRMY